MSKQLSKDAMVIEHQDDLNIEKTINSIKEKGWKDVTARGDVESIRALWFHGALQGITVHGYEPSLNERECVQRMQQSNIHDSYDRGVSELPADIIAVDYKRRVIPRLEKELVSLREERMKLGVNSSAMDYAYGSAPTGEREKALDKRFYATKDCLDVARKQLEEFSNMRGEQVQVAKGVIGGVEAFRVNKAVLDGRGAKKPEREI